MFWEWDDDAKLFVSVYGEFFEFLEGTENKECLKTQKEKASEKGRRHTYLRSSKGFPLSAALPLGSCTLQRPIYYLPSSRATQWRAVFFWVQEVRWNV